MRSDQIPRQSVVVALPQRLTVGTVLSRSGWPPHVTLASNFVVDVPREALEETVRRVCAGSPPLTIHFAGAALFGPRHDIPVQLVVSDAVVGLHERLAGALEPLPGFAAQQPAFWRRGYRPHMTHVAGMEALEGASQLLPYIAIADLDGADATVWAEIVA